MPARQYSLGELARIVDAESCLDSSLAISGIASLENAGEGDISFISNPAFLSLLESSRASAILVPPGLAAKCPSEAVIVSNPYLAYAQLTALFVPDYQQLEPGTASGATVAKTATVAAGAAIAEGVFIGEGATVAEGAQLHSGVVVLAGASIGANTVLYPNVTVYHDVVVGEFCVVHANTVIGADGFGFAPGGQQPWTKIHQLGKVVIGDRVEIGASCTIDRGALGDTVIQNDVILDDQVHVAHNCRIGEGTGIAGATAIAGSTSIGKNCTIAGAVGIVGHLEIADNVHITAMSLVTKSIREPGSYSSGTAMSASRQWRKNAVRFNQLDELTRRVKALEKQLDQFKNNKP